ncbi:dehydrogenase [Actinorhabdospora filicis]|uniref:Dehydrogenase n=1 Tax=Actinorhabdospora filicis TaxID=1785913 RepID=A0A9W6W6M1_9ACTN|nr:hydroxyacid dehydrogenase [Actinorhabdospora filicis]GLZ81697.1 dehydrogenase [Actinorhabdospora filicis]
MSRPRALLAMAPGLPGQLFDERQRARLASLADLVRPDAVGEIPDGAADVELLVTGWNAPRLDAAALDRLPNLRLVAHAAGTVKTFVTGEVFARGVRVTSVADANAIPVAEYTFAAILFGAKRALPLAHWYREHRRSRDVGGVAWLGTHGITIGVIGASRTGRRVIGLLRNLDAEIQVHDPYLDEAGARELGVRRVGLDELLSTSHVVSVNAPATPETRHLLDARRLALLPDGCVLVNTARGSLIDHEALLPHLVSGRIDAVLDVASPEPPPPDSPLYDLPNVLLTPHIAGALGNEVGRLGRAVLDEIEAHYGGRPMPGEVRPGELGRLA